MPPFRIPPQPIKVLHGDPRWSKISNFASWAPLIVLTLILLCIIQIALGAVWISKIDGTLEFALVLQPIVLPTLSLFNTVPSAQLHLYSRTNRPLLALWFSGIMTTLYLASSLVALSACSAPHPTIPSLCPRSASPPPEHGMLSSRPNISWEYWGANVALWLLSFVGYASVTAMAWVVYRGLNRETRKARERGENVVEFEDIGIGEEERAARIREAEERWRKIGNDL